MEGRDAASVGTLNKAFTRLRTKVSDLFVAAGCFACHNLIDGRDRKGADYLQVNYPTAVMERCLRALCETQSRWVEMGLIEVKGAEVVK